MHGAEIPTAGRFEVAGRFTLPTTGPRGALLRVAVVGVAAVAAAWAHARVEPGVLCPLRRLTGIPCPACGSTTVFLELGAGDLRGSFLANPVTFLAAAGLTLAPLGPGRWWWRSPVRVRNVLLAAALAAAWLYQLARFDLLPY